MTEEAQVIQVTVDYGQTLQEMIRAAGCRCLDADLMAKIFRFSKIGVWVAGLKIFHMGRYRTSSQVLLDHEHRNAKPAGIEHLLALRVNFPRFLRRYPFAAFGSIEGAGGIAVVPVMSTDEQGFLLGIRDFDSDWMGFWRFLTLTEEQDVKPAI